VDELQMKVLSIAKLITKKAYQPLTAVRERKKIKRKFRIG
jgi:hypothetical protein